MNREQMIAWLTLEGFVPIQCNGYWTPHDGVMEYIIAIDDAQDAWSPSSRYPYHSDVLIEWNNIPDHRIAELIALIQKRKGI